MQDDLATAPRNLFHIKRRELTDLGFRGLRKGARELVGQPEAATTLLLYPRIEDTSTLRDLTNRLAWYLPADNVAPHTIQIPVSKRVDPVLPDNAPEGQCRYGHGHLSTEFVEPDQIGRFVDEADRILCHSFYDGMNPAVLRNISRVEIIDPEFYSTRESTNWPMIANDHREPAQDVSRANFARLESQAADFEDSFVFATGPSLEHAYEVDFPDDSLKIICNSMVRNKELLEHINPDVLVFADPVFHFGPSRYANEFREDAVETLHEHDCIAVVPDFQQSLLAGHYPDIQDQLVGLEAVDSELPRFPSQRSLDVMRTSNIMTLFMLPIASALTDHVHIIGADGREEGESYFWEHSEEAQYDDELMQTAVDTHPSFFRDRVYTDYYQQHVETLTEFIEYGERNGVEYRSLTESHVPCLQERYESVESGS